jgi:electron transfer flavoprotein alpha subunit
MPDNATGDGDLGRRYAAAAGASVATHVVEIDAKHVGAYAHAGRAFATRDLPDVILLAPNAVEPKLPFVGAGERLAADFIHPTGDAAGAAGAADAYRDLGLDEIDAAQVALEEPTSSCRPATACPTSLRSSGSPACSARRSARAASRSTTAISRATSRWARPARRSRRACHRVRHLRRGAASAGIKDCRHVIAVNLDGSAPIAKRANLTVVGDAQATISALIEQVQPRARARGQSPAAVGARETEGVAA